MQLEQAERRDISLFLTRIITPNHKRHFNVDASVSRCLLNRCSPTQYNHVSQRHLLVATQLVVKCSLYFLQLGKNVIQFSRIIHCPVVLRRERDARTIGTTPHVAGTEAGR